jgi:hypothetical protein
MAPKHRTAAARVFDFINVSTARAANAGRAALAAHTRTVSDRAGLIDARIPIDVSGRARLVDPGVFAGSRPAHVSGGTRLVEPRIASDVSGRAWLIDARIAVRAHRTGVADGARLIDAAVACLKDRGNADRYDREAHCHGGPLD